MPPRLRKVALAVHLAVSIGWVGAVAAYVALDVIVAASDDPAKLRASYLAMAPIATYVIVPLAVATLITGLVVSLGTHWGLLRHYWVLISFALTLIAVLVLLVEMRTINSLASTAAGTVSTRDDIRALPSTLIHSVGGMVVLLVVLGLNVFKPQGLTRYGWRRIQRVERLSQETGEPSTAD